MHSLVDTKQLNFYCPYLISHLQCRCCSTMHYNFCFSYRATLGDMRAVLHHKCVTHRWQRLNTL